MPEDQWIIVPNWDKFQHYKDRTPIWIKLYLELNNRDDWRRLTFAQRGLLVSIWMAYGTSRCHLNVRSVSGMTGARDRHGTLESLSDAGWIRILASPEKSREEEALLADLNHPVRDPEAVQKIKAIAARIGK